MRVVDSRSGEQPVITWEFRNQDAKIRTVVVGLGLER